MLAPRVEAALAELARCRACPRNCDVDRLRDETGLCHTGRHAIVSSAFPHFGEEDCLRGSRGSGTICFSLCNLRWVFCQTLEITQVESGRACTGEQIASLMLRLLNLGCHNINFVTPEHVAPQVVEAIAAAVPRGLRTIAFPSISTGAYGFPIERAARIAVREVRVFLEQKPSIEKVVLVCFGREAHRT